MKIDQINSKLVVKDFRLDGSFFLNAHAVNSRKIEAHASKCDALEDLADVFNPPIFKRQFCEKTQNAIPYCQSGDVANLFEGSPIYVNKEHSLKVGAIAKLDQILITGFGTIGNIRIVNELSEGTAYANNVCRVQAKEGVLPGYLYAFLSSKYGKSQLNKNASGSVVRYIESPGIKKTLVPKLTKGIKQRVHQQIKDITELRIKSNNLLDNVRKRLLLMANLQPLNSNDYEYFGFHGRNRNVSVFKRAVSELSPITINAFNYSKRIENLEDRVRESNKWLPLHKALSNEGFFSTGSFPRLELDSPNSIRLINQSDIFHKNIEGKLIARKKVKTDKLLNYGEILIAGVGTLGENETFCRVIFANEELEGQLISGEFIRMKTTPEIPSGYLYAWLSSDYGFRFIRKTHTGTKLCRPIQELLKNLPVPILDKDKMTEIDNDVKQAHKWMYQALQQEIKAISTIENEIESWQKS